jgi:hypothetical protein
VRWKNALNTFLRRSGHFGRQWKAVGEILRRKFSRKR